MTEQEFTDAKALTLYFYASEHFRQSGETSAFMLDQRLDTNHPLYYAMLTAVCILYSKAFMNNRGLGTLDEAIVPEAHKETHSALMLHRHKFYAHTDTQGIRFDAETPINHVRIVVLPGELRLAGTQTRARPPLLPDIVTLTTELQAALSARIQELLARNNAAIPNTVGEYVVNTEEPNGPFLLSDKPLIFRHQ